MSHGRVCLICLVGLPASGKSTLARWIEIFFRKQFNVDIVCFDKVIDWSKDKSWKEKRQLVKSSVSRLIKLYLSYYNEQTLIILDDNMFYRSMRYEYYQLACTFEIGFCQIFVYSSLDSCLNLNKKRDIPVDENTIIKMNLILEKPDPLANKWEKNTLLLNQGLIYCDWDNLEEMIHNCLENPAKRLISSFERNTHSALHLADIALRQLVSVIIKDCKSPDGSYKFSGLELAKKRQFVLENIRAGKIILPPISDEKYLYVYSEYLRPYLLNIIENE